MDYTTLGPESKESQEQPPKGMQSLYEVCQQVVDGREARGKRYELAGLLVVLVLAKLAGMQSLLGASEWIADQAALLRERLQFSWKRMPCTNTYSYALARLDSQQVNAALAAWFERKEAESRCGQEPSRLVAQPSERHVHLAIDGKALRGTGKQRYGGEEPQKQILHVYEVQTGIVLQQCPIAPEHNAREYAQTLVDRSAVQRTHPHQRCGPELSRRMARLVKRAGGDVVLFIKDNTPATRADLELFFEDPQADRRTWQSFAKSEKGHGRLERRHITTSPDLNDYLYRDWGEVGQVFRLQRERKSKEKQSVEVIYGWTSLSQKRCCPQRLLALTRAHWAVENRLHWRRDATLGEDECGVRLPPVAQMLAVLNTVVLSLMDVHQVTNVARQIRRFVSHPDEALAWVIDF